jgi:hypothetical protein
MLISWMPRLEELVISVDIKHVLLRIYLEGLLVYYAMFALKESRAV